MIGNWETLRKKATLRLLQLHYEAQCGHLGGNLSCLDILLYLHHYVMTPEDVFILSKGHSAGALYVVLWTLGKITDDELKTFHRDGTHLCSHITSAHSPFGTGSLGHGLSLAVGMATAKKLRSESGKVYCLLSDGEMEEGSTKEAYNRNYFNGNIIPMIDCNHLTGLGVSSFRPNPKSMSDGHNFHGLKDAFDNQSGDIYFHTIKGKGTCYENKLESHYLPLSEKQYKEACDRL